MLRFVDPHVLDVEELRDNCFGVLAGIGNFKRSQQIA